MRVLEDTLAQQCLTTPLYPKTRLVVTRGKRDGSLVDYTNDVEVEIDYSDVDPELLKSTENSLETTELTNISSENS